MVVTQSHDYRQNAHHMIHILLAFIPLCESPMDITDGSIPNGHRDLTDAKLDRLSAINV
jgi:hypothetical protein